MPALDIVLYVVAGLLVLAGLAGAILPIIPGPPMIFGGLWLATWVDGYQHVSGWTIGVVAILGIIAMALDYVAGAFGAKRVGASKMAVWGALIGTVIGMFFGIAGIILGPFVGALVGELLNGKSVLRSTNVGIGTWIGMLVGMMAKLMLSFMMVGAWAVAWLV